jgi:hypothetical protein
VIPQELWEACEDATSAPLDPLVFAFDVAADRKSTAIAVCGLRDDRMPHVELVDVLSPITDAPARIAELVGRHNPAAVVADAAGPTAALLPALASLQVKVTLTTAPEHAMGAALFYDHVTSRTLHYRRTKSAKELDDAVLIATRRPLGDGGFAWSRKGSSASIAPLVACTLALWGNLTLAAPFDGPLIELIGAGPDEPDPHWGEPGERGRR